MFRPLRPKHWKTMDNNTKKQFAFTLIELLVVIAIIGILSALIIVGMNSTTQKATIAKTQVFSNSLRNSLMGNLVSEWRLDNGSGTTATDSWSGGNTGTLTGFADTTAGYGDTHTSGWMSSSNCISGACLKFDGTDDYVNCGNGPSLDITTAITLSAWVKTVNSATVQMIAEKAPSPYSNGYNILSSSGQLQGRIYPNSISSTAVLSNGIWHYVVMSNQIITNGWNLYFDGVNVAQQNGVAILTNAEMFYIGARASTQIPFTGLIDEVRIFNAAMSTSQIQQNYFAGINKLLVKNLITTSDYNQRLVELSNNYVKE